jgi:hypothetical protein
MDKIIHQTHSAAVRPPAHKKFMARLYHLGAVIIDGESDVVKSGPVGLEMGLQSGIRP